MNLAQLVDAEAVSSRRLVLLRSNAGSAFRTLLEPPPVPLVVPTRTHALADTHATGDPLTGEPDAKREPPRLTVRPRARAVPVAPATPTRAQLRDALRAQLREQARAIRLQAREAAWARREQEKRDRRAAKAHEKALAARARRERGKITPAVRAQRREHGLTLESEILGLLKAGPRSAGDLCRAMDGNLGSIYVALSNLRRKGAIMTTGLLGQRVNSLATPSARRLK